MRRLVRDGVDAPLQEHGYLVLRFLAEDVGAKMDMALDAILRGLTCRRASSGQLNPVLTKVRG